MTTTTLPVEEKKKTYEQEALITGAEAIAVACKLANVDVITAYPIRPYDTVMQYISQLVADGEMDCEFIVAEGEHSQFEIVKHASACGARVFCGSSGVGWMYAMECLTVSPALRVPMVCMVGNRALDDPGAFGVEHNDALAVRDLGWLLSWVDNGQEALDTALIAYRVAEDRRVFVPIAISCDGAFLTHSQALVKIPTQEQVKKFLPRYDRGDLLLHPDLVKNGWDYFRNVQTRDVKYKSFLRAEDKPALWLNRRIMEDYRPRMKPLYYDASRFDTYLEQLGIKYPTVR